MISLFVFLAVVSAVVLIFIRFMWAVLVAGTMFPFRLPEIEGRHGTYKYCIKGYGWTYVCVVLFQKKRWLWGVVNEDRSPVVPALSMAHFGPDEIKDFVRRAVADQDAYLDKWA